jgi:hypothetical protein
MKLKLILISLILSNSVIAQVSSTSEYFFAKEFSKEISLYNAKEYVMKEVLGTSNDIVQFEIDPLAAALSGEVTSLDYKCESRSKEGLILGFYGNYWNNAGVVYQGYGFKNLPKDEALKFLNLISKTIEDQREYLLKNPDNNNVYFQYDDILVLIYFTGETRIRLFWKSFDSEWGITAFNRTKRRFEKSIN